MSLSSGGTDPDDGHRVVKNQTFQVLDGIFCLCQTHPVTTTLWVKICGLSTADSVSAAVLGGADAVGFVMAPGGPRTIDPAEVHELVALVPDGVETVGVFRRQPAEEVVDKARHAGVTTVQLHGDEDPSIFDSVRAAGFGVIRATAAATYAAESREQRESYGESRLLLDAPDPGAGSLFDPGPLRASPPLGPWILAGGLTPGNVGRMVAALAPSGVDVSSGVESSRGVKDPDLIREFLEAARA